MFTYTAILRYHRVHEQQTANVVHTVPDLGSSYFGLVEGKNHLDLPQCGTFVKLRVDSLVKIIISKLVAGPDCNVNGKSMVLKLSAAWNPCNCIINFIDPLSIDLFYFVLFYFKLVIQMYTIQFWTFIGALESFFYS